MNVEKAKKPNVIFVMVVATVLLATAGFSTTRVLAYERSQSGSLANACGNGDEAFNVLCQNLLSQIEGDGNAVNIIGLQTGGERTTAPTEPPTEPPTETPDTCEECFTFVLTDEEEAQFLQIAADTFGDVPENPTFELICSLIDSAGSIQVLEQALGAGVPGSGVTGLELEEDRIAEIVECLHNIFGF